MERRKRWQDDRFADQPEPRSNCVRVYYKERGYHVDVPVYREILTTDPFTGAEKKSWGPYRPDALRGHDEPKGLY